MEVRRFAPHHLDHIVIRDFESREIDLLSEYRAKLRDLPDVYTLLKDGRVVVIVGMHLQWPGMAEGFMITTPLVEHYPIAFHKAMLRGIHTLATRRNLRRIQVVIHAAHPTSHKWITRLGFRCEGLMELYGPDGSDYIRYARIWRGK